MFKLYLKKDVENRKGFIEKHVDNNENSEIRCYFAGKLIYKGKPEEKLFCLEPTSFEDFIPKELQDLIISIHSYQTFSIEQFKRRRLGRYRERNAIATVGIESNNLYIFVEIVGDNLEDVKNIYYKIRAGTIYPTEDWEGFHLDEKK